MRPTWIAIAAVACAAGALSGVPFLAIPATYALLCYLPGRLIVECCRLGADWDRAGRGVLSLAFSLAVSPVVLNPLWHFSNLPMLLVGGFAGAVVVLAGAVLALRVRGTPALRHSGTPGEAEGTPSLRSGLGLGSLREQSAIQNPKFKIQNRLHETWRSWLVAKLILAVLLVGCVGTYFPTDLGGGPTPSLVHDYIKHHAVLLEMQRHALPLGNPFFATSSDAVDYYHFFYLIPATLRAVAPGVPIALAFGLQSLLVAVAIAAMAYVLAKRIHGGEGPAILAAMLATIVGGLDIIPLLIKHMSAITLDAWADTLVRIHALLTQMVWTPQNVSGVLIVLVAVYLLSQRGVWWRGWLVLGPVLGASLIGSTIWVAAAVLPGLVLLVLASLLEGTEAPRHEGTEGGGDRRRESAPTTAIQNPKSKIQNRLLGAGVVAGAMLLLALPSIAGYMETSRRHGKGLTLEWPYQQNAILGRLAPAGPLANLLDLPWLLIIELGALAVFPLLRPVELLRRAWRDRGLRLLVLSSLIAIAAFVTVRSHFTYNDFGQKVIFVVMIAGVLIGAGLVEPTLARPTLLNPLGFALPAAWSRSRRWMTGCIMAAVIVLGLPVSVFQTPTAAIRRFVPEVGPLRAIHAPLARQAAREAGGLRYLRDETPGDAVVQAWWDAPRLELLQMTERRIGAMVLQEDTHVFQGRDAAVQERAVTSLREVLEGDSATPTELRDRLRSLAVTHVFIGEAERDHWRGLGRFDDESLFERVFDDGTCRIYRLRPAAPTE